MLANFVWSGTKPVGHTIPAVYLVVSRFVTYYGSLAVNSPHTKSCLNLYHILEQIFCGAPGRIRTCDALANPDYKSGAVDHWATGACIRSKPAPKRYIAECITANDAGLEPATS